MDLTRRIRDKMMEERLMFVYRGVVTNENSVPLLMLLEKEMENAEFGFVGRKRLFMFVLESLQNVSRHSDRNDHANMSLVVYSKSDSGYTVTTGNVISTSNILDLKKKLDEINHLETKEIRTVYRQMLSNSEFSTKGGAGLGLIEMAKKTGNKLDYDFLELDNVNSYFILSKTVDSEGVGMHFGAAEKPFRGKAVAQLERLLAENNIYLIWSGHISQDVGKEVLSFTETKLAEDDIESNLRRRVFSILVEIIENVAKYSPGQEAEEQYGMPVAMIRFENNIYSVTTGNLILNDKVEHLKGKLDLINQNDKAGLKELFRKSLSVQTISTDGTGNMGLIDMARKSGSKLVYLFEKINDLYSYYTLTVKIEENSG
ncbi:MAG: SiaB family protein kinase [Bacteroidales bacterium]|nr:SiaB family protein kinase [Bacteroidales bacterium]